MAVMGIPWGKKLQGVETVLITGGSSGIGKCFIHQFKRLDGDLAVCNISRKKPCIESANFSIHHISCDLGKQDQLEEAARAALDFLRPRKGKILLINNSGFGGYGTFPAPGLAHHLDMIEVNVKAVVHLTALLLPLLRERGGAIVNIASTAAFQPTPYMAAYGASKAFLLHWSLSLGEELRGEGVHVLAVCPGPTSTRFYSRAGFEEPVVSSRLGQTPEQVVKATLGALRREKQLVVSGILNKFLVAASFLAPKSIAARLSGIVLKRFRLKKISRQ